jgi:hypothetical protein
MDLHDIELSFVTLFYFKESANVRIMLNISVQLLSRLIHSVREYEMRLQYFVYIASLDTGSN